MPNWTEPTPAAPTALSSHDEARLDAIRKLTHRLELMAGVLVGVMVLASIIGGAISAGGTNDAWIPAALSAAGALFVGVFFYTAVRLVCAAILFVCEHLAEL